MSGRCASYAMRSAYRRRAITPGDQGQKARARSPIANCCAISGGFMPSTGADMGAPRIHAELRAEGQSVSRKRVERVMRWHGIRAHVPRHYRVCTTDSKHSLPIAANLLDRNFVAEKPDQVWLADITYIPTGEGWLYLAVILTCSPARSSAGQCASLCAPNSRWPH